MPPPLYTQTVIAFIWDYDRTLIPSNQQTGWLTTTGQRA
jgi:hypothetical protein